MVNGKYKGRFCIVHGMEAGGKMCIQFLDGTTKNVAPEEVKPLHLIG